MKLSMKKARALIAVFNHPFHVDTISSIEEMYTETLQAIGDKGRLAGDFYLDLDRNRCDGIYTCTFMLSIRIDKNRILNLGYINDVTLSNHELRIDVIDGTFHYAVILKVED